MTMNENTTLFRTADLAPAAALCVSRFGVASVDRIDQRKLAFVFERSNRLNETIEQYWRGELLVEPQAYFNQFKLLKARIYES